MQSVGGREKDYVEKITSMKTLTFVGRVWLRVYLLRFLSESVPAFPNPYCNNIVEKRSFLECNRGEEGWCFIL